LTIKFTLPEIPHGFSAEAKLRPTCIYFIPVICCLIVKDQFIRLMPEIKASCVP
jgi:hypothetical protein